MNSLVGPGLEPSATWSFVMSSQVLIPFGRGAQAKTSIASFIFIIINYFECPCETQESDLSLKCLCRLHVCCLVTVESFQKTLVSTYIYKLFGDDTEISVYLETTIETIRPHCSSDLAKMSWEIGTSGLHTLTSLLWCYVWSQKLVNNYSRNSKHLTQFIVIGISNIFFCIDSALQEAQDIFGVDVFDLEDLDEYSDEGEDEEPEDEVRSISVV